uniref:Uncharacterized protein n=1 Tax=Magallana gigas TaxID=29159 RepID=A0A8W8IDI0_MAGGI
MARDAVGRKQSMPPRAVVGPRLINFPHTNAALTAFLFKSSCNDGSCTSICNTYLWRPGRIYRKIKLGDLDQLVCKRYVTDSTIDGETLRLGDSDLILQYHPKIEVLVEKKQRTCRHVPVGPTMPQYLADCCGSQLYDVNQSQCCRGTKTVIPNNLKCCREFFICESLALYTVSL